MNHCFRILSLLTLFAMLAVFPQAVMAQDITDGLVAYYPFTGDATDASGGGADCTVYGATLTVDSEGHPDEAYYFGGSSYMATPLAVESPVGTVSAWVYVESYQTGYNMLNLVLGQWDNLQLGLGDSSLNADGQWVFRSRDGAGIMKSVVGPLAEVGAWVHAAGVWDGAAITLYLDGEPVASVPCAGHAAAGGVLTIGRHSHIFSQNYWFGTIDEVLIYDRALSADEVGVLAGTVSPVESSSWSGIKAMFRD